MSVLPWGPPMLPEALGSVEGRFCFCQGCCGSEPPGLQPMAQQMA